MLLSEPEFSPEKRSMKMRNKGKVHPFTSASTTTNTDSLSVLKLLPAAILTLVSLLSLEDREVLAYMLTRSLREDKKKSPKKQCCAARNSPALFDCDCFNCYTSFWLRWDSSPNRELIHQAIEAFDDHLNTGDHFKNAKTKRRDKLGRRKTDKLTAEAFAVLDSPPADSPENQERAASEALMAVPVPEVDEVEPWFEGLAAEKVVVEGGSVAAPEVVVVRASHKGLARKVLPDFMGIFHSRYWSLWSPNV